MDLVAININAAFRTVDQAELGWRRAEFTEGIDGHSLGLHNEPIPEPLTASGMLRQYVFHWSEIPASD